jgi:predicted AAA+ superfamily ATPase
VAQHLYYKEKGISNPELFYWLRDKQGSSAEVDFVFSKEGNIYPVEVKAGKIGRMKSMEIFVQEKNINHAIRFNFDKKSVFKKENSTILSLPVYLVESV